MATLDIKNLSIHYFLREARVRAVDDVTFAVEKGTMFGLAGESGCGKTTTVLAIMRMLHKAGKIVDGEIFLEGNDLLKLNKDEMRKARWRDVSYIFQYAMNAFNPVMTVGEQIVEVIMEKSEGTENPIGKKEGWERAKELFNIVGLDPQRVTHYPHEFSGGMQQRAVIAMALACNPKVIIADEPVTALDVVVEKKILKLLKKLQKEFNLAIIMITHDLSVIAESCDRVGIMYAGKLVEVGPVRIIFKENLHPYTHLLINSFPSILGEKRRIKPLEGIPPNLANPPPGCRFHPRCPYCKDKCKEEAPELREISPGHYVACHFAGELPL